MSKDLPQPIDALAPDTAAYYALDEAVDILLDDAPTDSGGDTTPSASPAQSPVSRAVARTSHATSSGTAGETATDDAEDAATDDVVAQYADTMRVRFAGDAQEQTIVSSRDRDALLASLVAQTTRPARSAARHSAGDVADDAASAHSSGSAAQSPVAARTAALRERRVQTVRGAGALDASGEGRYALHTAAQRRKRRTVTSAQLLTRTDDAPQPRRLGRTHDVPSFRKERKRGASSAAAPSTSAGALPQRSEQSAERVALPTASHSVAQSTARRPRAAERAPQVSPPRPQVYQLGRPVTQRDVVPPRVRAQVPPPASPATIVSMRRVADAQARRRTARAHENIGAASFHAPQEAQTFAARAQSLHRVPEEKNFLDDGTVTYARAPRDNARKSAVRKSQRSVHREMQGAHRSVAPPRAAARWGHAVAPVSGASRPMQRTREEKSGAVQSSVAPQRAHVSQKAPARKAVRVVQPAPVARRRSSQSVAASVQKASTPQVAASRSVHTAAPRAVPRQSSRSGVAAPRRGSTHAASASAQKSSTKRASAHTAVVQERASRQRRVAQKSTLQKRDVPARGNRRGTHQALSRRGTARTAWIAVAVAIVIFGIATTQRAVALYDTVSVAADRGFGRLTRAVTAVKAQDFARAQQEFRTAESDLARAAASFATINGTLVDMTRYVPVLSKVSSGKHALQAGRALAVAGEAFAAAAQTMYQIEDPLSGEMSLLNVYTAFAQHVARADAALRRADAALAKVDVEDVPAAHRAKVVALKERLPFLLGALAHLRENDAVIRDVLGANGPRKYLFLFQNNHEIRATGGFIGSYGRLDIAHGRVTKFFIDGIYNPNGQLIDKIVPPRPIQKISAVWSLHDSNYFPDFPTSARKAMDFYERTGGPTVDGVIAITPYVLQRLLTVTGPIALPAYDTAVTAENFMERLQYEVEVDYDKAENRPKKILSDLAPRVLERIFASRDAATLQKLVRIIGESLAARDVQIYLRDAALQERVVRAGWSGVMGDASQDYLAVINTNINGYKTDGVIKEKIYHWAEIADDGTVVDTVRIVRTHTGGTTPYEWYNKVNADYIRVYVPRGAQLLSATGYTRETVEPPLDYEALGFTVDADVVAEEQSMTIDPATGTRIYEQFGKTVFANWIYVSPQETVTLEYKYKLPFRVVLQDGAARYSLYVRKQAGMMSTLRSEIIVPQHMRAVWSYPVGHGTDAWETLLARDVLRGVVLAPSRGK